MAVAFLVVVCFFSFWPLAPEVTAATINWSVVIYLAVVLFAAGYFVVYGRKEYDGPVALVKQEA